MGKHIVGKLICVIQLICSLTLFGVLWTSGMIPMKYLAVMGVVLFLLLAVSFGLQFVKNKAYIGGIVISIIVCISTVFALFWLLKTDNAMRKVGGATYKTDNMIVVVKKEDAAVELKDAGNYRFGKQIVSDRDNTDLMIQKINDTVGREINVTDYATVQELGQALLNGEVEAAIYNQAFEGILDELIEGYSDQVKILYQYGIDTKIEGESSDQIKNQDTFSLYISGIDVSGPITMTSRSDVNIIVTVNTKTKQILLTTTPRDYYVPIPDISGEQRDKLTHAGIYGVDASMSTLESIYGIDISYYAKVNFTSLIKIVDILGGVDVNSEYAFSAGGYTFNEGLNHLNGAAALAFSRERHSFAAGDNQRGRNQEAVLTAMLRKAMSPAILKNANQLLTEVSDSVETNMTSEEMAELIQMQLNDGAEWNIVSANAIGQGGKEACFSSGSQLLYVMWPDEASVASIKQKMQQVINGEVLTE
ncbi:LCP family protein [Faecalicatena sp. Marseille-Q4148]|nr:LCP family protein [Faecalicatena sp. Marseille-Q4148]